MIEIIEYKQNLKLDNKIKKFITEILFKEFKQPKNFERPDLQDFSLYEKSGGMFWLLTDGNNILGTIAIKIDNSNQNCGVLKRFYIDKTIRNKGFGSQLFNKVLDFCKIKKINLIKLNNDSVKMSNGNNFYIKKGFKETYRREDGYVSMELKVK